jgi:hypothetical protein
MLEKYTPPHRKKGGDKPCQLRGKYVEFNKMTQNVIE